MDSTQRKSCIGKSHEKKITITAYLDEYQRNNQRVDSSLGRKMKGKRQATVEPAWGTLTQFLGLRKINTLGIQQANKVVHLAACAYNLKKLLKYSVDKAQTMLVDQRGSIIIRNDQFIALFKLHWAILFQLVNSKLLTRWFLFF